ncbi:uncharacterized protein [Periplaneta americana]|uniref:uncharacterized protein n=1 Tax=Periplaneta americana TaxID=6978 RepID=UPI0037E7CC9F
MQIVHGNLLEFPHVFLVSQVIYIRHRLHTSSIIPEELHFSPALAASSKHTLTMKAFVMFFVAMSVVAAVCLAMPSPGEPKVEEFSETVLARARRSPMPGDKDKPRAHVGAKINEESGVGVKAQVNGRGTLYESDDGRSRVNVEGQWSKVLDGPQRGKPQHKAGISWEWDSD